MKSNILTPIFAVLGILFLSSCGVNSHIMFQGDEDEFITEDIPISPDEAYRISPDDKIKFTIYTEDGKNIIDQMSGVGDAANQKSGSGASIEYLVRKDGTVDLPIIGLASVAGLSIIECQSYLSKEYSDKYKSPFVFVEVTNRRVIIFPGSGGEAQVIPLTNNNTTLMEVIALAGGITDRGKAQEIKVIRKTEEGRKIYKVDLSTVQGLKYADMIVQANDYIYVEPTKQLSREILKEITPIFSIISSAIVVVTVILSLQ